MLVGYGTFDDAYLIYDPARRKAFLAYNVVFREAGLVPIVPAGSVDEAVQSVGELPAKRATEVAPPAPEQVTALDKSLVIRIPQQAVQEYIDKRDGNESKLVNAVYDMPAGSLRGGRTRAVASTAVEFTHFAMGAVAGELSIELALAAGPPNMGDEPTSIREALNGPDGPEWQAALDAENENFVKHDVYTWADPGDANVMGSTTVLRTKYDAQGEKKGVKVRVCAQGFTQQPGVHYDPAQKPAQVMRLASLRIMLAMGILKRGVIMRQFDVKSAYLHRPLREEVYMRPPPGLEHPTNPKLAWKLNKPLYGTIQGGAYWEEERDEFMAGLGWTKLEADISLYRKVWGDRDAVVGFWVDDGTSVGPEDKLLELEAAFNARYGTSGAGPLEWTLGIAFAVDWAAQTVALSQQRYIETLAHRFGQEDARHVSTPFAQGTTLSKDQSPATDEERRDMLTVPYRELVGALLWISVTTRPDIAFAVGALCKFMSNPGRPHWTAATHLLRYLLSTAGTPLIVGGKAELRAYSDADFAGDRDDRKSTGAYVFCIGVGAVSWASKKQDVTALSTLEAEYMAMTQAAKEAIWITRLMEQLGAELGSILIFGDNQGAMALARTTAFHNRSKHIDVQHHFIREKVLSGDIDIQYIPTTEMVADALTKSLSRDAFQRLCAGMGVVLRA